MRKLNHIFALIAFLFASHSWASPPNILLIVSEDNGPELGCYGDASARTPNLDRLAGEGIRFDRAFVPQAGCSQSRASFLTGLYPHQHGQIGLATWGFRMYRKDTPNLPSLLKDVGYRTGLIGKLHINPASAFDFDLHEITGANFGRKDLDQYAKQAESFIRADDAPFFLSVNYPDPHDPWIRQVDGMPKEPQAAGDVQIMPYMGIKSPEFRDMVADYYNCISRMDTMVGELLNVLKQSGKAENTIVIYIGDHGADMLRGKRTCYEGGLRIPMMIRWPGQIDAQVRGELVSTLDLMPTLLQAAGAKPVDDLPGASLQPLFKPGKTDWRSHLFAEYHTHAAAPNYFPQRSVRSDRYKLIESLLPATIHPGYKKTIEKLHGDYESQKYGGELNLSDVIAASPPQVQAAYELQRKPTRFQLYDLQSDPYEFQNLAADPAHAQALAELKTRLKRWREDSSDPLLDDQKLRRLTAEVQSVKKKTVAKKRSWQYPSYMADDVSVKPVAFKKKPNVLMIVVDDMNDWVGCLGGHPDVKTPNIDRLAARGMLFANAHCAAPVCNPSRVATMTGRRPGSTGIYDNSVRWHEAIPDITSIPQHFMANGYTTFGAGKVYHHMPGFNRKSDWHRYFDQVFDGHYQDQLHRGVDVSRFRFPDGFPLNGLPSVKSLSKPPKNPREFDWGPLDKTDEETGDGKMVDWAHFLLGNAPPEPYFLACGIYRPHLPFYAPQEYFDLYPQETLQLPATKDDDLDDLPKSGREFAAQRREDFELVIKTGKHRELVRAYLASITFADELVGWLLDGLEVGGIPDNTIIVFWSDHGWHLGEKQHLHKFTLWERSTHIPFIVVAPGVTKAKSVCHQGVDMLDLFPTLNELCGLPDVDGLDGESLVPLLKDPQHAGDRVAVTSHGRGNHAIRSERWRYIRYANGDEELYDHESDPNEWTNLAENKKFDDVKAKLRQSVPKTDAKPLKRTKRKAVK